MNESAISVFSSVKAFREQFDAGLERLLDSADLNLFILVCANAGFDPQLFASLRGRLRGRYEEILSSLSTAFCDGDTVQEAEDDLLVFLKIASIGFDSLKLAEQRSSGPWEIQFNHLRSFRPMRNSQRPLQSIYAPFDEQGFHFNKPFLQQEVIVSGEMFGHSIDLYYNKYPFVDQHCLLLPERKRCMPQYLNGEMFGFAWRAVAELGVRVPGLRMAYNALGAFASVNHLHFQLFVREQVLPVEDVQWRHNGGGERYPLDCHVFTNERAAWKFIEQLHAENEAYNLLFAPGRLYCMPRKKQGGFDLAQWSPGFSWYELCGGMITFKRSDFDSLDPGRIERGLALAAPA